MRAPRRGKRGRALRGPRSRRSRAPLRPPRNCRPSRRLGHPPLERRRCKPCVRPPDRASPPLDLASPPYLYAASRPLDLVSPPPDLASLDAVCARSKDTFVLAARNRPVVFAPLDAGRPSRSSAFAAPAPPAASPWRRAAASRRTARRSLAACPRSGGTFCRRASTWPCARSWGAILGGARRTRNARTCASPLWFSLSLFAAFKGILVFGNPSRSSNPGPPAPLGPAPAPRAPRGLPPLSAPLPLRHPARCAQGLLLGVEMWRLDVALHESVISCEPPSDQPQEACLPPQQERRRCLGGGGFLLPPCMRHRRSACATSRAGRQRLPAHRASRSASCRAVCRPFGRASASTAANTGAEGALSPPHMLPRLGPLFALVRRSAHQTANGSRRHGCEAFPRGTAMSLDPCLQCTVASARRERSSAIERALATNSV